MDFMKVFDETVLDATDDELGDTHGTALAEIAQATKKSSSCEMVMNFLWTRLTETGKTWRCVYKWLAVIEYLVAHGSERAVDEIVRHTYRIASLASFEYVEPNGEDMGIIVRKKAENVVALLNDKEKIQEARDKAAANHENNIRDAVSVSGSKTEKSTDNPGKAVSNSLQSSSSKYEVDLTGQNFIGDLLDSPIPVPADNSTMTSHQSGVDLFSDANFVSVKPQPKIDVDLFASHPASSYATSSSIDFFSESGPVVEPDHADPVSVVTNENATSRGNHGAKPSPKIDFLLRSGIGADSLSRDLIDLKITAGVPRFSPLSDGNVRIKLDPVMIFARKYCCMCHVMKQLLSAATSVKPAVIELEEDEISNLLGDGCSRELPALFIGGTHVGGLENLVALHLSGHLVPKLVEAGAIS